MSALSHGEFPSQQNSGKVPSSKGISQFKAPLRLQSGELLEQGQRSSPRGSTSSRGISQFKTPLRPQSGVQSGTLRVQNQPYSASGAPSFNSAPLYHMTNPSQPFVQQLEKEREQSRYHSPSEIHPSNTVLQHAGPTMSLPRVPVPPSVAAYDNYSAGDLIAHKSSVLTTYPDNISTDPYIGISVPFSSLEERRRRSPLFLSESDQSWQPALPRTEPLMRSEALSRVKIHVMMKVIIMGGTTLLVGGIASFLLLRFPTYLVVTWAILIIILSNLVSRELRSYYRLTPTAPRMEAGHPSTIATSHDMDMERHSVLKDISDTTGYLKALCLVVKPGHPAQNFPPKKEYRV